MGKGCGHRDRATWVRGVVTVVGSGHRETEQHGLGVLSQRDRVTWVRGVVTDLERRCAGLPLLSPGLVALRVEEVLELMAEDYPHKYQEYQAVMQERELQAAVRRKVMESKRMALMVTIPPFNLDPRPSFVVRALSRLEEAMFLG